MSEYLCVRRDHLQAVYDAALDADESGLASHVELMRAVSLILASPGYPVTQLPAAVAPRLEGGSPFNMLPHRSFASCSSWPEISGGRSVESSSSTRRVWSGLRMRL